MSRVESQCVICCFAVAQNVKTVQVHFNYVDKISVKKNHLLSKKNRIEMIKHNKKYNKVSK